MEPPERVRLEPRHPGDHRPTGGLAGSQPGGAVHRADHGRDPRGLGQRLFHRLHATGGERAGFSGAALLVEAGGHGAQVCLDALSGGLLVGDPADDLGAQLGDAVALAGAGGDHRNLAQPVLVEQPADVLEHRGAPVGGHGVDVVEHDHRDVGVAGQWREVAVVDGRVGVLLGVEHPHEQVGELDDPVDLEVMRDLGGVVVGQVEQDHTVHVVVRAGPGDEAGRVEHRVARGLVPRGDAEPLEQLLGALTPPYAGGGPGGGGAAYAHRRQLQPGQRVERRRLARAGGAGDRDHGVVGREPQPARRPLDDLARLVDGLVVQAAPGRLDRRLEGFDASAEIRTARDEPAGTLEQGRHGLSRRRGLRLCCGAADGLQLRPRLIGGGVH